MTSIGNARSLSFVAAASMVDVDSASTLFAIRDLVVTPQPAISPHSTVVPAEAAIHVLFGAAEAVTPEQDGFPLARE